MPKKNKQIRVNSALDKAITSFVSNGVDSNGKPFRFKRIAIEHLLELGLKNGVDVDKPDFGKGSKRIGFSAEEDICDAVESKVLGKLNSEHRNYEVAYRITVIAGLNAVPKSQR